MSEIVSINLKPSNPTLIETCREGYLIIRQTDSSGQEELVSLTPDQVKSLLKFARFTSSIRYENFYGEIGGE